MATQPEYALEEALLTQLEGMEYQRVRIDNEAAMLTNLKRQLEIHNGNISLTQGEFARVLNKLNTGGVTERAAAKSISARQRGDWPSLNVSPGVTASSVSIALSSFASCAALRAWTDAQ